MSSSTSRHSVCPVCSYKGIVSNLKLYQINEDEAIYMCTNKKCSYPIGACDPSLITVKRPIPGLKEDKSDGQCDTIKSKTDASTVAAETKATTEANDVRQNDDEPKTELDLMLEGILAEEAS